jgi:hypothetical protein
MDTSLPSSEPSTTHQKANRVISAERVSFIKRLLLQSKERPEILQICTGKWGVRDRQVAIYMAKARREIQKEFHRRDALSITWHIKARQNIIDKCIEANQPHAALSALQDIAKLQGLYIEKHEHTGKDGGAIEIKWPDGSDATT